jgi:hypothetical protein
MEKIGLKIALSISIVFSITFIVLGIQAITQSNVQIFLLNLLAFVNCCFANLNMFNELSELQKTIK